jgi:GvpD gas vesicle protein
VSALLDLPTEVYNFLSMSPPESLLIRGLPGTGKSTLAIGLLENFRGNRFLISGRVSVGELQREFPWMTERSNIHLIDAAGHSGRIKDAARAISSLRKLIAEPDKVEHLEGLWLPEQIQEAWAQTSANQVNMVVIDSWDALVERYLGPPTEEGGLPDRAQLERLLLDQMTQGPVFLILVLERTELTQLDYLVNAVLETTSGGQTGRPERWLHLRKLRGTRIDSPAYPFTLEGSRFHCIGPMPIRVLDRNLRPEPEPNHVPGHIWPGCSDFAAAFGRLRVGRVTLFEKDYSVANEAMALIVEPIAGHVVKSGGRVVNVLAPDISPAEVLKLYGEILTPEQIVKQVRFLLTTQTGEVPESMSRTVFPSPFSEGKPGSSGKPEITQFLQEPGQGATPNLCLVWVSALRALAVERGMDYGPAMLPGLVSMGLSGSGSHTVFLGPEDDPIIHSLRAVAATRIRLRESAGRVFVWGEQPITPSFVLTPGEDPTGKPYHLLRIV